MSHILVIDDEVAIHQMIAHALDGLNINMSSATDGKSGLSMAHVIKPDLIITDVMMPDISGYELTRALRREADFAHTPIMVLTGQAGLQDKLKSFEAGADDHLTKPFEPEELAARVLALLRRAETNLNPLVVTSAPPVENKQEQARLIAVHSLRGGIGASSLAVNLALGLNALWEQPTALLDLCMMAGQAALMLNAPLRRTWADIAGLGGEELDMVTLGSILTRHETGLALIAAPTLPAEAEMIKSETLGAALKLLKQNFAYLVADLPHDFNDIAICTLDAADLILLMVSPDMASLRAAAAALDTYKKLGYPPEKIKLVLNATFPKQGLAREKIESALGGQVSIIIPYAHELFVEAINYGQPPIHYKPREAVSELLEDYAFHISKPAHKKTRPTEPSAAWQRVYKHYSERRK
jgi:pilus assembly protein CpaE